MTETPKTLQLELPAGATGCGAEASLQGHRRGTDEDAALAQTLVGRLILRARALLHRLVGA